MVRGGHGGGRARARSGAAIFLNDRRKRAGKVVRAGKRGAWRGLTIGNILLLLLLRNLLLRLKLTPVVVLGTRIHHPCAPRACRKTNKGGLSGPGDI